MPKTRAGSGQVKPNLVFQGDVGITIPTGTTAQRNPSPQAGEIRYNTDLNVFEGYTGASWGSIGPYPFATVDYFVGDGSTSEFVLSNIVTNSENTIVTINGVQLRPDVDYDLSYPDRIRFIDISDSSNDPPDANAEITVRYFQPITASSVPAGSIGINELNVVDGSAGQFLRTDGAGNLSFATVTTDPAFGGSYIEGTVSSASIKENSIGIRELDVSDGSFGQVLATDGVGNLAFITLSGTGGGGATSFFQLADQIALPQIPDDFITQAKLDILGSPIDGYILSTDGTDFVWIAPPTVTGANSALSNLSSVSINASLIPASDSTLDLGSSSRKWRDLYLSGSSIVLGSATITSTGSAVNLPAGSTVGGSSIASLAGAVNSFANIAVTGQSTVTADSSTDTLTVIAGTGISITTNATNDSITITNSSPNIAQNVFTTVTGNTGTTTANSSTDTLNIVGTGGVSTSITGDTLTISVSAGTGTVNSGTASRLAYYATTGTAISETSASLSWNNSTSTLTATNLSSTAINTNSLTTSGAVTATEFTSTGIGTATITSGSDIVLDADGGAGEVSALGDLTVSGNLDVDGTIIHVSWNLGSNGSSDYTFTGPGFTSATNDPVLYLYRGFTYKFVNTTGASHPFQIRVSSGGAAYTSGVSGSSTGITLFTVPMNAPSTLYYQCTIHSAMGNTINIV